MREAIVEYETKGDMKIYSRNTGELIRCKDCRFAVDEYHDGECYCAKTNLSYIGADWEHYCSWAERRDNGGIHY